MTTPHPNKDLLDAYLRDTTIQFQKRKLHLGKDPKNWVRATDVDLWLHQLSLYWEFRRADDWRNKFRDALERGEVVEMKGAGDIWINEPPYDYSLLPDHYRICPPAPVPFECWVMTSDIGGLGVSLESEMPVAGRLEKVRRMREVTK